MPSSTSLKRTTAVWNIPLKLHVSDSIKKPRPPRQSFDVSFLEEETFEPGCWGRMFNIFSRCFRS